jgi:hypothetical protein
MKQDDINCEGTELIKGNLMTCVAVRNIQLLKLKTANDDFSIRLASNRILQTFTA